MPKVIGVLTSNTGSVIKDIINVSTRRNPNVYIRLYPVPVQGEGAGEKIAEAIKIMNKNKLADVLILARGGGSLEDLWPFNEEVVARAIYESELPIVSAVGHETDCKVLLSESPASFLFCLINSAILFISSLYTLSGIISILYYLNR